MKLQEIRRKHKRSILKAGHWTGRRIYSGLCTNTGDAAHLVSTVFKWGSHVMRREKLLLDCLIHWLTSIRRAIKNINQILTASLHYIRYINMPSLWSLNLMISFMLCVFFVRLRHNSKKKMHCLLMSWRERFMRLCWSHMQYVSFYPRHLNTDKKQKRKLLDYCDKDRLRDYGCPDTAAATCRYSFPFILVNAFLR